MKENIKWLLKYRTKEIMGFTIAVLIITLLALMISWDSKEGLKIKPAAEIKIEVKK